MRSKSAHAEGEMLLSFKCSYIHVTFQYEALMHASSHAALQNKR